MNPGFALKAVIADGGNASARWLAVLKLLLEAGNGKTPRLP
jgi:hypothetical protein